MTMCRRNVRRGMLIFLGLVIGLAAAQPALAAPAPGDNVGGLVSLGCVSDLAGVCGTSAGATGGLGTAHSVVLSPDGKNAYVASENGALSTFTRDAATGALTFSACIKDASSTEACPQNSAHSGDLAGAHAVGISPDGKFVYVAASTGSTDAVTVFSRDSGSGALTPVTSTTSSTTNGCISEELATCRSAVGLKGVANLVVTGPSVYAISPSGTVARLVRDSSTGGLTQGSATADCFRSTTSLTTTCGSSTGSSGQTQGLQGAAAAAVPPDGKNLYVVSRDSNALVTFTRDTSTGAISAPSCEHGSNTSDCTTGSAVGGLNDAQGIDATDSNLYVAAGPGSAANTGNTVAMFSRDATTGAATASQCYREAASTAEATLCSTGTAVGLSGADAVAVTSDGQFVYVAASSGNDVAEFSRDTGSGNIAQLGGADSCAGEATSTDCPSANRGAKGLGGASSIVAGPAGAPNHAYVTGPTEHAVAAFAIERAPTCTSTRLSTGHGHAKTGNLKPLCLDPNGDPLTFQKISDPTNGTVTLNPDGSYTYTPNSDFSGIDSFSFQAGDGHVESGVTTVTIRVTAPQTPPPPPPPHIKLKGFPTKIKRSKLFSKGIQFTETPNGPVMFDNDLFGSEKGLGFGTSRKYNILLASQSFGLDKRPRHVTLKPDPADINTTKPFKLKVRIRATTSDGKQKVRFKTVKVT